MINTITNKNYTKSINCTVKSLEFVNITWMKNGVILEDKDNLNITYKFINNSPDHLLSVSTISFISPKLSDSGFYECKSMRININGNYSALCSVTVFLLEIAQSTNPAAVNGTSRYNFFTSHSSYHKR